MATVRATYSEVEVYVHTQTDLNWRTTVHLSATPVHMSEEAAQGVFDRASGDESLSNLRLEPGE